MAKRQASLLSSCQSTHKRQRASKVKADDDETMNPNTLFAKMCTLEIVLWSLNMNLNIHVMILHI